jgi:cation transport ATPase
VLQNAAKIDAIVFDKTGTVTEGRFEIIKIIAVDRSEDDLLALTAAAERGSDHTLARVIVDEGLATRIELDAVLAALHEWGELPNAFAAWLYCGALGWVD